ncbi:AAA family ATPase [Natrarchaeobaculum sulfurireducens]|uniref:Kinase n=1 Tax=Natrarchaeobaculum sulfurireducens TaxID=2044521 RepID=A0A346PV86_9EURY|nr:AAA family ATPase [Natrarchaeobaculum sulfurireducens]AXR83431.1 hypothetical protein AArcMg_3457 [Natrarchaeobaculum sulfurireducens]
MASATLIVCCGLPGVGKSAASAHLTERLSGVRYRSDVIRKQLFPDPEYTAAETAATYDELLTRARADLEAGSAVVLDATFKTKRLRDRAATVARESNAAFEVVHVVCDPDVVETRIENRTDSVSDADLRVHYLVKESFESIERDHVVIDNSNSLDATRRQLDRSMLGLVPSRL